MLRILTVMTTPLGDDGISTIVLNYVKNISQSKIDMDFILPNNSSPSKIKILNDLNTDYYVLPRRMANPIMYMHELRKIVKQNKYNIIHVHGNSHTIVMELAIAKLNSVPVRISHAHSTMTKFPLLHKVLSLPFYKTYTLGLACGKEAGKWMYNKKNSRLCLMELK